MDDEERYLDNLTALMDKTVVGLGVEDLRMEKRDGCWSVTTRYNQRGLKGRVAETAPTLREALGLVLGVIPGKPC